jgi:serine protease DegS
VIPHSSPISSGGFARLLTLAVLALVAVGLLLLILVSQYGWPPRGHGAGIPLPTSIPPRGPHSYADAVARATPSVVNIFTSKLTTRREARNFVDPVLQQRFGHLLPDQIRQQMETSLGSGVVISTEGHVLTNLHILEEAEGIKVLLSGGRQVKVSFIGKDAATDLAVLRLDSPAAPAIPIGSAEDLRVGDVVLAIGNPFGMGQTVTQGIVSATGRTHLGISDFESFIQTDAAINPGNSGGALIDARGELVGINTAIYSKSGGSHGIGFAIPVNIAMDVLDEILDTGQVVRGWIGITGREVNAQTREAFGLRAQSGVMVSGVLPDGPADQAGLNAGDVITHIDNRALHDVQDLLRSIAKAGPGKHLKVTGLRGSRKLELSVLTTERPAAGQD